MKPAAFREGALPVVLHVVSNSNHWGDHCACARGSPPLTAIILSRATQVVF